MAKKNRTSFMDVPLNSIKYPANLEIAWVSPYR
jgi:hypothetical protein